MMHSELRTIFCGKIRKNSCYWSNEIFKILGIFHCDVKFLNDVINNDVVLNYFYRYLMSLILSYDVRNVVEIDEVII